jgi:hypothetical protein
MPNIAVSPFTPQKENTEMNQVAFVISLWTAVHPSFGHGVGRERIANALVEAMSEARVSSEFTNSRELLATMAYYVARESNVNEYPAAFSWDAKAGVSCGILQEPCAFVKTHGLKEQALWWLKNVHDAGLASVDSDPKRAAKRLKEVKRLIEQIDLAELPQE